MSEDSRQKWRYFSALLRFGGAYWITKTGVIYIDIALSALVVFAIALVIDPQRSYSRLSPRFRKRNVRIAIGLGSCSVTVLGMLFYAQACLFSASTVWEQHFSSSLRPGLHPIVPVATTLVFLVAMPFAAVKAFRDLNFGELIYGLPRKGLIRVFVYKEFMAQTFGQFACIEVAILGVCLLYASTAADMAKMTLEVVRLLLTHIP